MFAPMTSVKKWALLCLLLLSARFATAQSGTWIATWTASPEAADADADNPMLNLENQTVRERVRVSVGGPQIRLLLSNEYGTDPLLLGAVTVGSPRSLAAVEPGSIHAVTFNRNSSIAIPAGAPVLSDPIAFAVSDGAEITISLFFPKRVRTVTWHELALKHAVLSRHGDYTQSEEIQGGTQSPHSIVLSAVLVPVHRSQRVVIAFGDSIVDGDGSTMDADQNWPSHLIRRLQKTGEGAKWAVVNEGIAGNRLLSDGPFKSLGSSAMARFDRDGLSVPGVTDILLFEGLNDIGFPGAKLGKLSLADPADARTAEELIDAYRQLIARAHVRGVKIIGCTLNPFEGVDIPGYYSEAKEAIRQNVNQWIRTGAAFDGVIDFDRVLRDPDHPSRLAPRFASEDHLHPNDTGYQAMAEAIDLALMR